MKYVLKLFFISTLITATFSTVMAECAETAGPISTRQWWSEAGLNLTWYEKQHGSTSHQSGDGPVYWTRKGTMRPPLDFR
jgi:hypothetical protein